MEVRNAGRKCIGFGSVVLLPEEVKTLPEGFGPEHPVVKFYIAKKWLVPVEGGNAQPLRETPPPPENRDSTGDETTEALSKAELESKIAAVRRMNLEPLRTEASALGIAFEEDDTRDTLRSKIVEKLQAE